MSKYEVESEDGEITACNTMREVREHVEFCMTTVGYRLEMIRGIVFRTEVCRHKHNRD